MGVCPSLWRMLVRKWVGLRQRVIGITGIGIGFPGIGFPGIGFSGPGLFGPGLFGLGLILFHIGQYFCNR